MSASLRLGFVTAIALVTIACGHDRTAASGSPTAPTPTNPAPTPATGYLTLSGTVTEPLQQGSRPLPGVSVNAWVQQISWGYSYWWANGSQTTDAAGGFRLPSIPAEATVQLQVWKDGYVQQCAAPSVTMRSHLQMDVQLVSRANLSALPESMAPSAPGFRSVSGAVVERTAAGTQPVAGVFVDFEPVMDFPAATTFSDATGRYLLCGLPDGQTISLGAGLGNRVAYINVPPGRTSGVDILLP